MGAGLSSSCDVSCCLELARKQREFKLYTEVAPLRHLLETGDLVLVRATYFLELAKTKRPLPRRQDLPGDALVDKNMLDKLMGELEALVKIRKHVLTDMHFPGVVAISYAWAAADHPDGECKMLREVLAPAIEWYLSERAAYVKNRGFEHKKFRETVGCGWSENLDLNLDAIDFGIFLDYGSMFQAPRTDEENEAFGRALRSMDLLYAHQMVVKFRFTRPLVTGKHGLFRNLSGGTSNNNEASPLPYDERGWPLFETATSSLISGSWHVLNFGEVDFSSPVRYTTAATNTFLPLTPATASSTASPQRRTSGSMSKVKFDGRLRSVEELAKQASYHNGNDAPGVAGLLKLGRPTPMLPAEFAETVRGKTFTNDADVDKVLVMYERLTKNVLSCVETLDYSWQGWGEPHATAVAKVLLACPRLREVRLHGNSFGEQGVETLFTSIAEGTGRRRLRWEKIRLSGVGAGDAGTKAIAKLIRDGSLPSLTRIHLEWCDIGDFGFAAIHEALVKTKLRPFVFTDGNHDGNPSRDILRRLIQQEVGYKPLQGAPGALRLSLVPEDSDRALVFEYADSLRRGFSTKLTLLSHPGMAVVPLSEFPHRTPDGAREWSVVELGIGPADLAVRARFRGSFLQRVEDGRVFNVPRFHEGGSMVMSRSMVSHPNRSLLLGTALQFQNGVISCINAPHLVLGLAKRTEEAEKPLVKMRSDESNKSKTQNVPRILVSQRSDEMEKSTLSIKTTASIRSDATDKKSPRLSQRLGATQGGSS